MPPKKKADKDKKDKGSKGANPGDLESQEKLNKTALEIDILLKELEHNSELNERLKSANSQQRSRIESLQAELENKQIDRLEITSDMSRQYKSMQSEMTARINALEAQVADLKQKLSTTQSAGQESTKEFLRIIAIKDEVIEEQNVKMSYMAAEFENMLADTLQKMSRKLDVVSNRWKEQDNMQQLSDSNSRKLADFHLRSIIRRQDQ